jgi:spore maturation protein A
MIVISTICAISTGRIDLLADSILSGANESIKIVIQTLGAMMLWSGIMRIAMDSGITEKISKLFYPVFKFLLPEYSEHKQVIEPVCMNIVSNLLGLGNASTPSGIKAMKEMQKINSNPERATNGMIMFLILNTECLQLVPTFLIVLYKNYGSKNPFDILPIIWITTIIALTIGVFTVKLLNRLFNSGKKKIYKKIFFLKNNNNKFKNSRLSSHL